MAIQETKPATLAANLLEPGSLEAQSRFGFSRCCLGVAVFEHVLYVRLLLKGNRAKDLSGWPQTVENVQTFPSAGFVSYLVY